MDIPVGNFKVSHLHEHQNLLIPAEAPRVHYYQSEGEDLCVLKSLASALNTIGFAIPKKVGQCYAEMIQLPQWTARKVQKRPHMCDWQPPQGQSDIGYNCIGNIIGIRRE